MTKLLEPENSTGLKDLSAPQNLSSNLGVKDSVQPELRTFEFANNPKITRVNHNDYARTDLNLARRQSVELTEEVNLDTNLSRRSFSQSEKYRIWHSIMRRPKSVLDRLIDFIVKLLKSIERSVFGVKAPQQRQSSGKKTEGSGPGAQTR